MRIETNNILFRLLALFTILTVVFGCKDAARTVIGGSINEKDTLKKYERFRTVFYTDSANFTFFKDSINERKIAIFSYDSTNIKFYQLIDKQWMLTDSIKPGLKVDNINYRTLNNDSYPDIIAQTKTEPNDKNIVFMFDDKNKSFRHNIEYDMSHVYYDKWTLSSKVYFDLDKRHWEQTSYRFSENDKKVPYRSYEIFTTRSIMAHINFFQYNKGNKHLVKRDSGKVEGIWYSGDDWIEALSKDYHIWYKENLK